MKSKLIKSNRIIFLLLFLLSWNSYSQNQMLPDKFPEVAHPRLLLLTGEEKAIGKMLEKDVHWKKLHQAILTESDVILAQEPIERIQIGRRLLDKSREALRRIFQLSYAYRLTGEEKYFLRAEKEMLAISQFRDWNPSHFLDVAEMTMAMAIGYDWLFENLSSESRTAISQAIVRLGIEPSFDSKYNSFLKATHNWNQVCNAGMIFGALAVFEDYPELAQKTLERAIVSIPLAMKDYQPDGAYPEGYGYWGYGTSFNVLFLSALEKVYGTDFGLSQAPGFLETAGFYKNMTGATGFSYNWGDAGSGSGSISPAMFWFAQKNNKPSLLWVEKNYFETNDFSRFTRNRILPAALIWGSGISLDAVQKPASLFWKGQGANPLAMMRTSWTDPKAIYLGFKAGSPSVNHGHMDIGSFIMESDGVRWAMDFGMQDYESLESKGIQLFGRTQVAQRWTVFRLNNYVHNTLTIDGELQRVDGYAKIDQHGTSDDFPFAVSDVTSVYEGQLKKFQRGVAIVDQSYILVRDEIRNKDSQSHIRWNMLTPAHVALDGDKALLTEDGKKLHLIIQGLEGVKWKIYSTDPKTDYDAPNPGTVMVGFEYNAQPGEDLKFQVLLVPENALGKVKEEAKDLSEWK
jgi:hypothetical protein